MNGAFGKIPERSDFVRVGYGDAHTRRFEAWLDEAYLRLREMGGEVAEEPLLFVVRFPDEPTVLVGGLGPSRDAVGRRFPLAFYQVLDWRVVGGRWSGLPFVMAPALEAGTALLRDVASFDAEKLRRRVESLWSPSPADLERGDAICANVLTQTPWLSVAARVLGAEQPLAAFAYAVQALRGAIAQPSGTVECPVELDVDLFFWLELARRLHRGAALSLFWTEGAAPRAILGVGAPLTPLLAAFAHRALELQQIWPLTTQRKAALDQALAAHAATLEPAREQTIGELFDALAREGGA